MDISKQITKIEQEIEATQMKLNELNEKKTELINTKYEIDLKKLGECIQANGYTLEEAMAQFKTIDNVIN